MDVTVPFWMARLKVERAERLINELRAELEHYRNHHGIKSRIVELEGRSGVEVEFDGGPISAGPVLGDLIHNLRSALDLMASELARLNGKNDKDVYFPIADSEQTLDKRIKDKCFHLAGDDAVKLLKEYAPYRGGNVALRAIHEMDIQDKHTALIPTARGFNFLLGEMGEDGQFILTEAPQINPASINFQFPHDTAFAGDDLLPTTEKLVELVRDIVESFAALVAARAT